MKLRVVELLIISTIPAMVLAERGLPSLGSTIATLLGGTLAAGSANAFNQVIEKDIDKILNDANKPFKTKYKKSEFIEGFGLKKPVELTVSDLAIIDEMVRIIENPNYEHVEEIMETLSLEAMEKQMIDKALKKYKGRRKEAAEELGISERTLYRKIKQYDL